MFCFLSLIQCSKENILFLKRSFVKYIVEQWTHAIAANQAPLHLSSDFQPSDGGGDAGGGEYDGGDEDDDRGCQHFPHRVSRPGKDGWRKEEEVQVRSGVRALFNCKIKPYRGKKDFHKMNSGVEASLPPPRIASAQARTLAQAVTKMRCHKYF